jgi:hypothetical protein
MIVYLGSKRDCINVIYSYYIYIIISKILPREVVLSAGTGSLLGTLKASSRSLGKKIILIIQYKICLGQPLQVNDKVYSISVIILNFLPCPLYKDRTVIRTVTKTCLANIIPGCSALDHNLVQTGESFL